MAIPWLRLIDAAFGLADLARSVKRTPARADRLDEANELTALPAGGALEARLTGVVVAALKEAFNRDHERMELEREQMAAERARAERVLRMELARQAAEREIGRLRLIAGIAVVSWLSVLFFSTRLGAAATPARIIVAAGWLLLLAALAAALTGQARIGDPGASREGLTSPGDRPSSGPAGQAAPWLLIAGLALVGLSVMVL